MTREYRIVPTRQAAVSYLPREKEGAYIPAMDAIRKLVKERAVELGIPLAELSRRIGRNQTYVQQFITKNSPSRLPERERAALARELRVDESRLKDDTYKKIQSTNLSDQPNAMLGGLVDLTHTVPLYGSAMGGKDGRFVLNGNKIRDILAPPELAGIRDAYAVSVVGESMEPRFFAGEHVYVNPRAAVRRGDFVIVQTRGAEGDPPDAYVKRFVSMDAVKLRVSQYNPEKLIDFPIATVVSVHRIVIPGL